MGDSAENAKLITPFKKNFFFLFSEPVGHQSVYPEHGVNIKRVHTAITDSSYYIWSDFIAIILRINMDTGKNIQSKDSGTDSNLSCIQQKFIMDSTAKMNRRFCEIDKLLNEITKTNAECKIKAYNMLMATEKVNTILDEMLKREEVDEICAKADALTLEHIENK